MSWDHYIMSRVVHLMDDNLSMRALFGMKTFYKAVMKYLQNHLPHDNELFEALTCLSPREPNSSKSFNFCKTFVQKLPCITKEEEINVV